MKTLQDKVVLVSGATSGIGQEIARLFAAEGAALVLAGRRSPEGNALAAELTARGAQVAFQAADVTRAADHAALVELAVSRFGRLDIAVNNAGVEATGPLSAFDEATYERVFDTNVRAVFLALRAQVPELTKTRGSILVTSSIAGIRGMPGASVYAASKHAVEGIVKSAALELAPLGIRVNAVAPGPIATQMLDRFTGGHPDVMAAHVPLGRLGASEEIAQAALWLVSPAAAYTNGAVLRVDGGMSA